MRMIVDSNATKRKIAMGARADPLCEHWNQSARQAAIDHFLQEGKPAGEIGVLHGALHIANHLQPVVHHFSVRKRLEVLHVGFIHSVYIFLLVTPLIRFHNCSFHQQSLFVI